MRKGGAGNIRKHSWQRVGIQSGRFCFLTDVRNELRFSTFEWEKYDNGNMPSPYRPQARWGLGEHSSMRNCPYAAEGRNERSSLKDPLAFSLSCTHVHS